MKQKNKNQIKNNFQKIKKQILNSKLINSNSIIFLILLILDQLVKQTLRKGININYNIIKIVFVKNSGIIFGLFQNSSKIIASISILIILILLLNQKKISDTKEKRFCLILIIAGLLSNTIDRIILGYVTDFLCISIWPCFNLADSYLVIGVFGYLFFVLREKNKNKKI